MKSLTLASIAAARGGRLPAGIVMLLADEALERMAEHHAQGTFGLDVRAEGIRLAESPPHRMSIDKGPVEAPWLLAPERQAGRLAHAGSDLFALGVTLLELLLGRRWSSPALLTSLAGAPPIFHLVPTIPGALERSLLTLLRVDFAERARSADDVRALLKDSVASVLAIVPDARAQLVTEPESVCRHLLHTQARAEAERAQALVHDAQTRSAALVSLLRSAALIAEQPDVAVLLGQAVSAGVLRGGAATRAPALAAALAHMAAHEPNPPLADLRKTAHLLEEEGEPLYALAVHKRVAVLQPHDKLVAARIEALTAASLASTWSAAGAVPGPLRSAAPAAPVDATTTTTTTTTTSAAPTLSDAKGSATPAGSTLAQAARQLASQLAGLYGNTAPRARLFMLVLAFSALSTCGLLVTMRGGPAPDATWLLELEQLRATTADCPPGGRRVLLHALLAARHGAPERVQDGDDTLVPLGTRCQESLMRLGASAELHKKRTSSTPPCGAGGLDVNDFVAALERLGIRVATRTEALSAIEQEFANINDAMATGVPIPKLARRVTLSGVNAEIYACPGKAQQACLVSAYLARGPRADDPPYLAQAAEPVMGALVLPAGPLVFALTPTPEQDAALFDVAVAIAKVMRDS